MPISCWMWSTSSTVTARSRASGLGLARRVPTDCAEQHVEERSLGLGVETGSVIGPAALPGLLRSASRAPPTSSSQRPSSSLRMPFRRSESFS